MTIQPEEIAKSVKEVRRQLGLSQEDLARELGVSFATVNRWENGKTSPSKLARNQFNIFCERMRKKGRLNRLIGLPAFQLKSGQKVRGREKN